MIMLVAPDVLNHPPLARTASTADGKVPRRQTAAYKMRTFAGRDRLELLRAI
jgi:hypothetical protein